MLSDSTNHGQNNENRSTLSCIMDAEPLDMEPMDGEANCNNLHSCRVMPSYKVLFAMRHDAEASSRRPPRTYVKSDTVGFATTTQRTLVSQQRMVGGAHCTDVGLFSDLGQGSRKHSFALLGAVIKQDCLMLRFPCKHSPRTRQEHRTLAVIGKDTAASHLL